MNKEINIANNYDALLGDVLKLLKQLISIPSFSKEEDKSADTIELFLKEKDIYVNRFLNNVWAANKYFDKKKFTVLLNSQMQATPMTRLTRLKKMENYLDWEAMMPADLWFH